MNHVDLDALLTRALREHASIAEYALSLEQRNERLRLQLEDWYEQNKPLCESKGCKRAALGYVEHGSVRWLACGRHRDAG